jgi:hypothetical protein
MIRSITLATLISAAAIFSFSAQAADDFAITAGVPSFEALSGSDMAQVRGEKNINALSGSDMAQVRGEKNINGIDTARVASGQELSGLGSATLYISVPADGAKPHIGPVTPN